MTLLLGSFFLLLLLKMPISFALLTSSILYLQVKDISFFAAVLRMSMGIGDSFPLLSVPFFILAGNIMNTGGITERIFSFADRMTGHVTGGLGHANILASIIFSGMSGTALADAGGLGAIELKAMKDAGYDEDFSLAITSASSIIGPIIPPSVPAVVFGVIAGVSIGRLFIAGIVPGLIMAAAMATLVHIQSKKRKYARKKRATLGQMWESTRRSFFPLMTPVIIIGSILGGVITPTEAALLAVVYSLILSICYGEFGWRDSIRVLRETAFSTVSVMFIVSCSSIFGWILASERLPQKLAILFLDTVPNKWVALVVINLLLLVAGTFMETVSALTVLTPVLMPVANSFGIDPVHFGIVVILNLMIGLLTPPVGMVLYVLAGVSNVPFEKITRAVAPYLIVLGIAQVILTFVPQLTLWLPNYVFGPP